MQSLLNGSVIGFLKTSLAFVQNMPYQQDGILGYKREVPYR